MRSPGNFERARSSLGENGVTARKGMRRRKLGDRGSVAAVLPAVLAVVEAASLASVAPRAPGSVHQDVSAAPPDAADALMPAAAAVATTVMATRSVRRGMIGIADPDVHLKASPVRGRIQCTPAVNNVGN